MDGEEAFFVSEIDKKFEKHAAMTDKDHERLVAEI